MAEQDFIKAGFTVVGTESNENKLLSFLKENYPNVIRDTEINLEELKTVLGLPIDEKVNGYGLNFVGRNFARAKYAQKTEKELSLNNTLSKNIGTTENLVLKGDNLDSLKILKNHYSGQIKCIYIDPPYNTTSDEFVYPDKFDKEETEVLGLANLSESDFTRMDFSFKTKKSHNGWLAFMYPRILLARDLLSKDGVIFISIDDNEQSNLKLLCDDVFGEDNFIEQIIWRKKSGGGQQDDYFVTEHDYILCYSKNRSHFQLNEKTIEKTSNGYNKIDINTGKKYKQVKLAKWGSAAHKEDRPTMYFALTDPDGNPNYPIAPDGRDGRWRFGKQSIKEMIENKLIEFVKNDDEWIAYEKEIEPTEDETKIIKERSIFYDLVENTSGSKELTELFESKDIFDNPKPSDLLQHLILLTTDSNDIILDFFAGSGTAGHAVMELNKEGGSRKFILCQIDEPIDAVKKKKAYDFCIENNLTPVISSITIERLKRAGEKIAKDIETENSKAGMYEEDKKQIPDIGFKVFDSVEAPKLKVDETSKQISISVNDVDALSRIYNMVFTVGLDEPTQVPEEVVKDSIYKIGNHYYITNSDKITSDDYADAIKNGKVFIDGWTASLNGTLQNYKEDVKIVF
ncbi:MAG: site-specific DNA-methyltransferase [Bacteroidetes bacterium]|nr:site-specific DNA-methyltransferase [Bacteroidota bacterium]